jgi:hypothetical protein
VKDFLINVTSFFRDGEAFKAPKGEIGSLLKDRPAGSLIRAWIPGCSAKALGRMPLGTGFVGQAAETKQVLFTADAAQASMTWPPWCR